MASISERHRYVPLNLRTRRWLLVCTQAGYGMAVPTFAMMRIVPTRSAKFAHAAALRLRSLHAFLPNMCCAPVQQRLRGGVSLRIVHVLTNSNPTRRGLATKARTVVGSG